MGKPKKSGDKKDNTNKVAQTVKLRAARKVRQKKRDEAPQKKVLRRAAEGNVSWETKPNKETNGIFVISAKGGSKSLLRKMVAMNLLRVNGNKLVPV